MRATGRKHARANTQNCCVIMQTPYQAHGPHSVQSHESTLQDCHWQQVAITDTGQSHDRPVDGNYILLEDGPLLPVWRASKGAGAKPAASWISTHRGLTACKKEHGGSRNVAREDDQLEERAEKLRRRCLSCSNGVLKR
jgi:hypothetical protein